MKRSFGISACFAAVLSLVPALGFAGSILGPTAITTDPSGQYSDFVVENLINQSGLSANYTPYVTDFDAFTATTTSLSASGRGNGGFASPNNNVSSYDFHMDFGQAVNLSRFALWNDSDYQGIGDFTIYSADSNYNTLSNLGSFTASISSRMMPAQVFDFIDTMTQYVVLSASTVRSANLMNVGEFAFEGSTSIPSVPVPAALPLLVGGIALLGALRHRAKASA